jgi:hypothetical protein
MTIARPADAVRKVLGSALLPLGFEKRHGILTIPTADAFVGWLGINATSRRGVTEVNLVVGVRSEEAEALIGDLTGKNASRFYPATISIHIGNLMPIRTYHPWYLPSEPSPDVVWDIVQSVREIAVPFMRSNSDLRRIVERLGPGVFAHREHAAYRLPVCWLLLGDKGRARAVCEEDVRRLGDRTDPAAQDFRQFARALESRL